MECGAYCLMHIPGAGVLISVMSFFIFLWKRLTPRLHLKILKKDIFLEYSACTLIPVQALGM